MMNSSSLADEAHYLTHSFFHQEANDLIVDRYQQAHRVIFDHFPNFEVMQKHVTTLVNQRADIEAIEYAWRIKHPDNILSKKTQILFYLLESQSQFYPHFIHNSKSQGRIYLKLVASFFSSLLKLLKGRILMSRYGIV